MLKQHTIADVRLILAQMDALIGRNKRDKERLKRYLFNTTELDEERIGQVASLTLAHESAEDVRHSHGNTRRGTVPLTWSGHSNLIWKLGQWRSASNGSQRPCAAH
jgi:hypothetical protein